MTRIFGLSLLGVLAFTSAHADCMKRADKQTEAKIDGISAPVYDGRGNKVEGCILHTAGKVLGYARNKTLCSGRAGSTVKVRLSFGCCDTGPDFGDVECIVRSRPSLGIGALHGNGVWVQSAT
jgi:hypothetical protein